jgi:hypothetical protein
MGRLMSEFGDGEASYCGLIWAGTDIRSLKTLLIMVMIWFLGGGKVKVVGFEFLNYPTINILNKHFREY